MKIIEVYIDLDKELAYIHKRLDPLSLTISANKILKNAINETAKFAEKEDNRITKRTYTAKQDINSLQFKKATTANLEAVLKDKGANISMAHFNHYAGKKGVSAIINKNNGRKKIGKYGNLAFYAETEEGGEFIAVRHPGVYMQNLDGRFSTKPSKHTEAIEKIDSASSPVMRGNDNTWGIIEDKVYKKLRENIEERVDRWERILST